jgi:hypothetical protein
MKVYTNTTSPQTAVFICTRKGHNTRKRHDTRNPPAQKPGRGQVGIHVYLWACMISISLHLFCKFASNQLNAINNQQDEKTGC